MPGKRKQETHCFSPEVLKTLLAESGTGYRELARAAGIETTYLYAYANGTKTPSLEAACRLADYFAVPLDYLAGRTDMPESAEMIKEYRKNFGKLRRAAYEAYLQGACDPERILISAERMRKPWPYRLYEAVGTQPDGGVVTADHEKGIAAVMSETGPMRERERHAVDMHCRCGMTLAETGRELGCSGERARQLAASGLRRIAASRKAMAMLELGFEGAEKESAMKSRQKILDERESLLEEREASIRRREAEAAARETRLDQEIVESLGLSVRAVNALHMAGIFEVRALCMKTRKELMGMRGLGPGCANEIERRLAERGISIRTEGRKEKHKRTA